MRRRRRAWLAWCGAACVAAIGAAPADHSDKADARVPDLRARLAALGPADPAAYFNLAEEVAVEMRDSAGRRLAQELYVLAFEAARAQGPMARARGALGPSVCLALADLASSERERKWLLVMARLLAESAGTRAAALPLEPAEEPGAEALAAAIDLLRAGEGAQARDLLKRPEAQRLVPMVAPMLGSARRLFDDPRASAGCATCRNRRTARGQGDAEQGPCPQCGGNPGAALTSDEFIASLRVEGALVGSGPETWSADLLINEGRSLDELGPDALAQRYGLNPKALFWEARPGGPAWTGAWVERP